MNYSLYFLIAVFALFILGGIFVLTMKYVLFGLKFFIAKIKHKENLAALFVRSRNNSLGLPFLVNDSKDSVTLKIAGKMRDYPLLRKDGSDMKWFNLPMYIFDAEDMQNELGFSYKTPEGKIVNKKEPQFIGSESIQVIVDNELLTGEFTKLQAMYKKVFLIVAVMGCAVAFNAYTSFELLNYINNL